MGQDRAANRQETSEPSQSTAATVRQGAGPVQTTLGQLKQAEQTYRESNQLWERLSSQFPDKADYREHLSDNLHRLTRVLYDQGQRQSAFETCHRAIEIKRKLARDFPAVPRYRASLARSLNALAICSMNGSRYSPTGDACQRECLELYRQLAKDHPNIPAYSGGMAMCLHNLGNVHKGRREFVQAEQYYRESIVTKEQLLELLPDLPEHLSGIALSKMCIGLVVSETPERWDEAEAAFRESIKTYRELARRFPSNVEYRGQVPYCLGFLARLLRRMNRLEEAEVAYRECAEICQQLVSEVPDDAESHRWIGVYFFELATVLNELNQHLEAERAYQSAMDVEMQRVRKFPAAKLNSKLSELRGDVIAALATNGQGEKVEGFFRQQLATWRKLQKDCHDKIACLLQQLDLHYRFAQWLTEMERDGDAETQLQLALEPARQAVELAAGDSSLLFYIAPVLLLAGEIEEYRQLCRRLLDAPANDSEEQQRRVDNWNVRLCGLDPSAAGDPERVLRLAQEGFAPPNDQLSNFLYALGRAYYRAGDREKAVEWLQKALEKNRASAEPLIYLDLALAHHYGGRHQQAQQCLEKAVGLLDQSQHTTAHSHERVEIEVLRREAERLIHGKTKSRRAHRH